MTSISSFKQLGLKPNLLAALSELGYEAPTPIQAESIPTLLEGKDILAQAQTGTGKTASFALPTLSQIDLKLMKPQALVIAPTRELAIQVAEAFQSYAKHLKDFHVTPIYGGQDYQTQLRALKRGTHVIVGTPGRVMDHLRRGTLSVKALKTVVLDEADEMLKMGFIEDIEWILEQIPHDHQTALFSATMPASIQKISKKYLTDAVKILIKSKKNTVDTIEQYYTRIGKNQKLDALTRFLEIEDITASIIFTRTKNASSELAEKLQARGYAASALNGDMNQAHRKKVVERIKKGGLDIIVATDVAARGIDVERVSHVINYDIPHDAESYIHRIGRTGRAGRSGKAILFVTQREQHLLRDIERAIHKPIKQINSPSIKEMNEKRNAELAEKVVNIINKSKNLGSYFELINSITEKNDCRPEEIAAALAYLIQDANPLPSHDIEIMDEAPKKKRRSPSGRNSRAPKHGYDKRSSGDKSGRERRKPGTKEKKRSANTARPNKSEPKKKKYGNSKKS
jgi:ATP-dependent RNA helicase DeaD